MLVARRNLLRDRLRFALSVAGVALSIMLILVLRGYLDGTYRQFAAYLEEVPGTLVATQAGTKNFLGTNALIAPDTVAAIARAPGVERAIPVLSQSTILELHGRREVAFIIGAGKPGGGPWRLAEGRAPAADDELALDRVVAARHDVALGDQVTLLDRSLRLVGLTDETAVSIASFGFVPATALESSLRAPGAASFVFVTPDPTIDAEALRARLDGLPGVDAMPKAELIERDRALLAAIYDAPLGLMVAIAFGVGVLVVGLVIYTATIERRREYGALKAIGAPNRSLYATVAVQALIAAVPGAAVGVGLAFGVAALLQAVWPQFLIVIEPRMVGVVLGSALLMALAAALAPARAIAGLAPAEVFRG
jgi:putative ABC transport system permease protein